MADAAMLLHTWESAQALPPAARLLVLAAPEAADLPMGAAVASLLARHRAWFGPALLGVADCPDCGTQLDVGCDVDTLLDADAPEPGVHALDPHAGGVRFRLPTLADLDAVATEVDEEEAARLLLDRCLIDAADDASLRERVAARMAELDPLADAELELQCEACGGRFTRALDVGAFLWREIEARVLHLLGQVHALARAYGWREADILAMSPARRQVYLDLIGA